MSSGQIKFTALKVGHGDSFLIEINGENYLIDTGPYGRCKEELELKGITLIHVLIITHYDHDHANGLMSLLKSNITIKEIWLPDNFERINLTLKENRIELAKILNEYPENNETQTIKMGVFFGILREKVIWEDPSMREDYIDSKKLKKIGQIIKSAEKRKIKMRWFKYVDIKKDETLNNCFIGVNCIENTNIKSYQSNLEFYYYLKPINQESLVFKFSSGDSEILFTSDSGFHFVNSSESINLKQGAIVTAPHHGSDNPFNERGYQIINGDELVYVRSDNHSVNISKLFYREKIRYCTKCRYSSYPEQEIILNFENSWNIELGINPCTCN